MTKHLLSLMILLSRALAFAHGGMIGGGEVKFKALMTCDSKSIDPTYPGSPHLWIVKEVDWDGNYLPQATLRVVTLDDAFSPVRYYVTHERELTYLTGGQVRLDLWRYDEGSNENHKIGLFAWDGAANKGSLTPIQDDVEELQVYNCAFSGVPR